MLSQVTMKGGSYGSYRLWGTLGWGIFGLIAGLINDAEKLPTSLPYLIPGLIMFVATLAADIVLITARLRQPAVVISDNVNRNHPEATSNGDERIKQARDQKINREINHQVWFHVRKTFQAFPKLTLHCIMVVMIGILTRSANC